MVFDMGHSSLTSIFITIEYFTHFRAPQGSKGGTKWGKRAHLLTNSHKNLQIWADMIFNMGNLMVASIFNILEYFTKFGAPWGSIAAENEVKLPISKWL